MTIRLAAAGTTALALAWSAPALAQEEIVFGISASPGSLQEQTASEFARRANEKLGDTAVVKVFDSSQLGPDKDMLQKVKLGTVHITLPSSIMPEIAPEYAIFDLPFWSRTATTWRASTRLSSRTCWCPRPRSRATARSPSGRTASARSPTTSAPSTTPADLDGLKIRTPNSSWRVSMFEEWGSNPTPMAFSEVFVALQTGVIDGQENPLTNIAGAKLDEVQEYLSMSNHVYSPAYPTVGVTAFEKLDPEIQQVLVETAQEVAVWAREKGAADDEALREELSASMEVNETDRQAFVEASKPIYDRFAEEVEGGQEMIDQVQSLSEGS